MRKLLFAVPLLAFWLPLFAGRFYFIGDAEKNPLEYRCGEEIVFRVLPTEEGKPLDGIELRWERMGDDGRTETGRALCSAGKPVTVRTSLDRPGFVYCRFNAYDRNGEKIGDLPEYSISAGADIGKIRPAVPEPAGFDAFWTRQKARLAAVPMENVKLTPVPVGDESVLCRQFEVPSVNGPVYGYLSYPAGAAPGVLKAVVQFHGYGFGSVPTLHERAGKESVLMLSVGRHGLPQGKPQKFYDEAKKRGLKNFGFRGNEDPADCDFVYMLLRDLRAVEFLAAFPQWNGRDLEVCGGSMGAMQAIAVAALDGRVSRLSVRIPWLADLGGVTVGRVRGWRPDYQPSLNYFDIAFLAKRVRCPAEITIGLGDRVCPATGELAMFNNMSCSRVLVAKQSVGHRQGSPKSNVYRMEAGK